MRQQKPYGIQPECIFPSTCLPLHLFQISEHPAFPASKKKKKKETKGKAQGTFRRNLAWVSWWYFIKIISVMQIGKQSVLSRCNLGRECKGASCYVHTNPQIQLSLDESKRLNVIVA